MAKKPCDELEEIDSFLFILPKRPDPKMEVKI
jgi:hypothetical protein